MPRPMIQRMSQQKSEVSTKLSMDMHQQQKQTTISDVDAQRLLRKQRSKEYMDAMTRLDAGLHLDSESFVQEAMATIENEMPFISAISDSFVGLIAKCYLGEDFEVHIVDFITRELTHFRKGEPMPEKMERCRNIAQNPNYELIEVYEHSARLIGHDGSVSEVKF